MKKILILVSIITLGFALSHGQSGFSFSSKKWAPQTHKNIPGVSGKMDISIPTTGTGFVLYGTPSFISNFITLQYANGSFTPTGSFTPGLEYSLNFGRYNVTAAQTNITNYAGLGVFATAGGIGNILVDGTQKGMKGSFIAGACISISSYGQIGYGYDFINKNGSLVIGAAFPLNIIEQGILATKLKVWPK